MGAACNSSSKKNHKDVNSDNANSSTNQKENFDIDVVPDDQIPKDLIQRTLKKVDTSDVEENYENSPLQVCFFLKKLFF